MKYHLDEFDSMKELHSIKESLRTQYIKMDKQLAEKKEKLFKSRDLYKWGGFKDNLELQKLQDMLLNNKEKAFGYMMPKETAEVEHKREEYFFYSNQCWDEVRRVSFDNAENLKEHFKEFS